jgi:hypothetical protein
MKIHSFRYQVDELVDKRKAQAVEPPRRPAGRPRLEAAEEDQAECDRDNRECLNETQTDEHLSLQHTTRFRLTSDPFDRTTYNQTVTNTCTNSSQTKQQTYSSFHFKKPP